MQKTPDGGSIPGSERSPGEGHDNHSGILVWETPDKTEEPVSGARGVINTGNINSFSQTAWGARGPARGTDLFSLLINDVERRAFTRAWGGC